MYILHLSYVIRAGFINYMFIEIIPQITQPGIKIC
jgi:hypothetical protein